MVVLVWLCVVRPLLAGFGVMVLRVCASCVCSPVDPVWDLTMTAYFEARRIGGGDWTEARMKEMMASVVQANVEDLAKRFEDKMKSLADTFESYAATIGRPTTGTMTATPSQRTRETFVLQTNPRGELSSLPNNFQFPKGGMYDCWVQWNVGHG
jgi:hypothetical protein